MICCRPVSFIFSSLFATSFSRAPAFFYYLTFGRLLYLPDFTSVNGAVGTFLQRGASARENALCGHTPDPLSALAIGRVPWVTRVVCCSLTAQVTMTRSEGSRRRWPPQHSLATRPGVASQATQCPAWTVALGSGRGLVLVLRFCPPPCWVLSGRRLTRRALLPSL